jgi:hypothetical protein
MAEQWYYTANRQQMGPVSFEELQQLATRGLLKPSDLVWTDGMSEWVKASLQKGLFAEIEAAPPKAKRARSDDDEEPRRRRRRDEDDDDESPRQRRRRDDDDDEEPRQRRRRDDDDDDDEDERRRRARRRREDDDDDDEDDRATRRRRARQKEGMAVGLKIGLAIGGGVFLLLLLGFGFVFLLVNTDGTPSNYSINNLQPKTANDRNVFLKAGKQTTISMTSTSRDPRNDVDLFVYLNNRQIISDVTVGPNATVTFFPPQDGFYKIQVQNIGFAPANCQVRIIN